MKINNELKCKVGVAVGILFAWVCIIAWAFYKEMETKMIVLFFSMFFTAGLMPVILMFTEKNKKKKCKFSQ